jgi:RNA polymerase sigma factor (sigma-70 family)
MKKLKNINDNKHFFIGKAIVFNEEIYINTLTGMGYNKIIDKMKNYIDWYSKKIRLSGFEKDDIKQLICMIILDGVRRYNSDLKVKLSTFLHIHIRNRLFSRIKQEMRQSLNATYNETLYKFICSCGAWFISNKKDAISSKCILCKKIVDETWITYAEHYEPTSLDAINDEDENRHNKKFRYAYDLFEKNDTIELANKNIDIVKLFNNESKTMQKIAELIYYQDYSVSDVAREIGLSHTSVSLRLKRLGKKEHIREYFVNR